jgi:hypothetical protein
VQGVAEQLPNVTLYYDANTLDSLTDCPVLNDTPYEYVPKHLPPTFQARATTAGKHTRAAASGAAGEHRLRPTIPTEGSSIRTGCKAHTRTLWLRDHRHEPGNPL